MCTVIEHKILYILDIMRHRTRHQGQGGRPSIWSIYTHPPIPENIEFSPRCKMRHRTDSERIELIAVIFFLILILTRILKDMGLL